MRMPVRKKSTDSMYKVGKATAGKVGRIYEEAWRVLKEGKTRGGMGLFVTQSAALN